jgi:hypothetical protein
MTEETTTINRDARIAIIGAGPAGLSAAWFLSKNNFHNVTVLEKLGRVGGLCKSITIKGMSYDIGANYVTWAYTETLKIAKELDAKTYKEKPYTSIEIKDGKARYRPLQEAVLFNPFTKEKVGYLSFMIAALRYLWIRIKLMSVIDRPDYLAKINYTTHPELCVSFKDWLRKKNLDSLASLFEFPVTIMGYGQLRDIAAPYVLRYISLKTFFPMVAPRLPLIGWIIGFFFPWPRRFTMGFQRLWQKVAWRTNVRLNINIKKIRRSDVPDLSDISKESPKAPIVIDFEYVHQEMNKLDIAKATMNFDYLILACPLTTDVFDRLKLTRTSGEEEIFGKDTSGKEKITVNPYCMTTYWVNNMDMPEPIAPILPLSELGKPWAVARQFQHLGNKFTQFYTQTEPIAPSEILKMSDDERLKRMNEDEIKVKEEVKKLVALLDGQIDTTQSRWNSYDRFTYFQHWSPEQIGNKYYENSRTCKVRIGPFMSAV